MLISLLVVSPYLRFCFFFFNDTATTEIYTLSLHDALPICARRVGEGPAARPGRRRGQKEDRRPQGRAPGQERLEGVDRKSTRLNSSHLVISYAVFCLKKKKINGVVNS